MIKLPTFAGETAILGLGRSGLATVAALLASGNQVVAWDDKQTPCAEAEKLGADIRNLAEDFGKPARLVVSPGVPLNYPAPHHVITAARAAGCAILGDLDLFAMALAASGQRDNALLIGITGTNGKSTSAALIGHMLDEAGWRVEVGGNIGTPVLTLPLPTDGPVDGPVDGSCDTQLAYVLELSSYQLDLNRQLACDMGIVLNITPDHLDRHGDMTGYIAAKELIFANGHCAQLRVIGMDDADSRAMAERQAACAAPLLRIAGTHTQADIYYADGCLWQGSTKLVDMADCPALRGAHNGQNAAAALAIGRQLGLDMRRITDSFTSFAGMPHRLQAIAQQGALTFVNDSKATNIEATRQALAAFGNIYWIAGGRAKLDSAGRSGLMALEPLFGNIRAAYLIGEAGPVFADELPPNVPTHMADTLDMAVAQAAAQAQHDNLASATILLSPACASFDQFSDFEARGAAFCAAVDDWCATQQEGA